MTTKKTSIWIWLQDGKILKAVTCSEEGVIRIYDEHDNLLLKRTGLTRFQVKQIEENILRYGAKRLNKTEPFKFLGK